MSISGGSNRILLDLNVHKVLATAAAAVSQELWTSGGALFQRAQEPNIPFGESLTSTKLHVTSGHDVSILIHILNKNIDKVSTPRKALTVCGPERITLHFSRDPALQLL